MILLKLINSKMPIKNMFYYKIWEKNKFKVEKILNQIEKMLYIEKYIKQLRNLKNSKNFLNKYY